jgi:hypothetical protein
MKLAVAACVAIALCLGSLAVRALVRRAGERPFAPPAAARTAQRSPAEKRALATLDKRLHRKLRRLAKAAAVE